MRKLSVVLAVLLLAVMAVPVLAAVVFEWHTGDACIWNDWNGAACSSQGIRIYPGNDGNGQPGRTTQTTTFGVTATNQNLYITSNCTDGRFAIMNGGTDVRVIYFNTLPQTIDIVAGYHIELRNFNFMDSCYVTDVQIGDPDPPPFYGVPGEIEPGELETMSDAGTDILRSAATTILPMIIGLAVGMGIVVTILRMTRWL